MEKNNLVFLRSAGRQAVMGEFSAYYHPGFDVSVTIFCDAGNTSPKQKMGLK